MKEVHKLVGYCIGSPDAMSGFPWPLHLKSTNPLKFAINRGVSNMVKSQLLAVGMIFTFNGKVQLDIGCRCLWLPWQLVHSQKLNNRPFAAIDHVANFPVATRLWWASEPDIPWQQYSLTREAWLFQDYVLTVCRWFLTWNTSFWSLFWCC